jgi:hypothetical protein
MLFSLSGLMDAPVKPGHDAEFVSTHRRTKDGVVTLAYAECVSTHRKPAQADNLTTALS